MIIQHTARAVLCVFILSGCDRTGRSAQETSKDSTRAADSAVAADTYHGPKACDLVSSDDVTRIAGGTYHSGVVTNDYMGDSQCKIESADTSAHPTVMVTLHVKGNFEPYRKVPGIETVAGIGDEAVWNSRANQLGVRVGEAVFSVSLLGKARQEWAAKIARLVLPKLSP